MPKDTVKHVIKSRSDPAEKHYLIAPGPGFLDPIPSALLCNVAGTATIEDAEGTAIPYNLAVGQEVSIRARRVTAATAQLIAMVI